MDTALPPTATSRAIETVDLLIIGGGVNGCGIARDAAGRGLSVAVVEKGDLAQATSSASSKLFHGGLRYLEYFEFRLVREALREREVLLRAMPHIARPMRFVIPYHKDMRFEAETPASRLLSGVMPWMKGRRPAWMIRLGLFLYDHLGGRKILPATQSIALKGSALSAPLQPRFERAFEYSDVWVDDARLVVLNARDAAARGAAIHTRTAFVAAKVEEGQWLAEVSDSEGPRQIRTKALINAAGPWAGEIAGALTGGASQPPQHRLRLVRGSHIVTRKLFDHDRAYFLQGTDGRIIFVIPYERDFTMIGTTDVDHAAADLAPRCSLAERDYLCDFASRYFAKPVTPDQVLASWSGVRPLYDDGASSASAATRDYVLTLDQTRGAPLLHCFGGKITTYRKLAEAALRKLAPALAPRLDPDQRGAKLERTWTSEAALPGGDLPHDGIERAVSELAARHGFLSRSEAERLLRAYGSEAPVLLNGAQQRTDLGRDFGAGLSERELEWMVAKEWARSAEDALTRRSKLYLHLSPAEIAAVSDWFVARFGPQAAWRGEALRPPA